MRISHRYRFVFFANPKTGSSSVREVIDPYSDIRPPRNYAMRTRENPFYPHIPPAEARDHFRRFGWDFDGYTKFVFVRNPWAKLVSLYEHIRRGPDPVPSFDEWVYTINPDGTGDGAHHAPWRRYGSCSIEHFIKDASGGVLVDKVIRLEDIDHALRPFLEAIGLPVRANGPIPHKNRRRNGAAYTSYYTPDAVVHVRDLYHYDIVNYGYEFEAL
jgi:hypothetical protein